MRLKLVKLSIDYKTQLEDMLDEWVYYNNIHETNHSPWAIFKNDYHDFDNYLNNLDLKVGNEKYVKDSTFFALDEDLNIFVGAVNIRHYLNDALLQTGGHIGDGIRPSMRHKGYGNEIIRLALLECKKLGIEQVLICCDKNNPASRKTIINNGGVFENEVLDGNEICQRYWINLSVCINELSSDYEVKKLKEDDLNDIYSLCVTNPYYYQYCLPFVTKEAIKKDLVALPENVTLQDKYFLGFYEDNKLIAIMDLIDHYPYAKAAFIGLFMVDSHYSRQGIGSSIIQDVISYFENKKYCEIRLGHIKGNRQAAHFWKKNGFIDLFETKNDQGELFVANKVL